MEQKNASSRPIVRPAFTNAPFASAFPGIASTAGNISNPLYASTLHHLQELSATGSTRLLQSTSQLALGNQLASEINNAAASGWQSAQDANAAWLEQAKVAAILPMYTVFSTGSMKSSLANDRMVESSETTEVSAGTVASASSFVASGREKNCMDVKNELSRRDSHSNTPAPSQIASEQSSPISASIVVNGQPGSLQSHCSIDVRSSSHGPNSVSYHGSVGSIEYQHTNSECDSVAAENLMIASSAGQSICTFSEAKTGQNESPEANLAVSSESCVQAVKGVNCDSKNQSNAVCDAEVSASTSNDAADHCNRASSVPAHDNPLDTSNIEDLPWSSIDFGDIDLFGGASAAEKDVMHSVLDMEPSVMHRLFMNEPSTSAVVTEQPKLSQTPPLISAQQLAAPNIREKVTMRREKELADADKELDRFLSLVAKKDAGTETINKSFGVSVLAPILAKSAKCENRKISLSPVQFTPPDSPTSSQTDSPTAVKTFFFPSNLTTASSTHSPNASSSSESPSKPLGTFVARIEKQVKPNKIPVYKQNAKSFMLSKQSSNEQRGNDAYSFVDEEDEKPLPTTAMVPDNQLKEQRIEAEVAQKLAKIRGTLSDTKANSNIEIQNQDLWRHVVPKKRHSATVAERPSVPSTPLLPPASVDDNTELHLPNQKICESSTIAETLKKRKQHRSSFGFLKTSSMDDKDTARNECLEPSVVTIKFESKCAAMSNSETGQTQQPLPKLLIRLPRRSLDDLTLNPEETKKKKKKRKQFESDREWEGSESHRKRKKKKQKHKHRKKEKHEDEYENELSNEKDESWSQPGVSNEADVFSKKKRLMMHWNEAGESIEDANYCREQNYRNCVSSNVRENQNFRLIGDGQDVLPKFSPANGNLAKGTFVVCKTDVLKEDCPLWKIDNQNLLQKYLPIKLDDKRVYKNSSTYSGWCDQIADGYSVVQVNYITHNRFESIVEPVIALLDMFPAVSSEYEDPNWSSITQSGNASSDLANNQDYKLFIKDVVRCEMVTYIKAMLKHSLDLSFLQVTKQGSDWNYLCALNDIDKLNQERKEKIKSRVTWVQRYENMLHIYSNCVICDADGSGMCCQACGAVGVEKVVQLFCNEGYNYETLEPRDLHIGSGSPMHALEYLVCCSCARLSTLYHKLHHMRYKLLVKCEDQMEKFSSVDADLTPEAAVNACMSDHKWLYSTINEYVDCWKKIETNLY